MHSRTLLCIDDRTETLQFRKSNLESLGYSVLTASSASTAIATLERSRVAAVLMQYKTEGIDAEAIAHHIKQRFPNQPVILLSAYADIPERVLWLIDDYILRSEYPHRLGHAIARVTGQSPIKAEMTLGVADIA